MAVDWSRVDRAKYSLYTWQLTSADDVATPTPPLGHRPDCTVEFQGVADAAGWNGATLILQGTLPESGGTLKPLQDHIGDAITATATNGVHSIDQNCSQYAPLKSAGTLGATGVTIILLCSSARPSSG